MANKGQLYFGLFLTRDKLLMAIILLSGFLALAVIVSMMRIYKKCGKPAISVIIPIWGQIVLFQITSIAWWYIFIPIVNLIMMIKAYIILAKKFGKSAGFAVGMIFLPMIFIPLLSFYDYVGDEKNEKIEEPIYNPFNETNVEPVNVKEPVVEVSVSENISPVLENQENEVNVSLEIPTTPIAPASTEKTVSEIIEVNEEVLPFEPVDPQVEENTGLQESVIPEIPVVNNVDIQNNEVVDIGETTIDYVTNNIMNPSVQDIEDALNINKEPSQIAFNSTPIIESVQEEILEPVQNVDAANVVEDVIELPEIAAKVCPACGVSLAENINFCTSCGTKL